ncbi:hypothetical protein [Pseudomonas sp. OIL-1]|uniref:hypothetical protein n=1 Tax=Pseudomonas sp. OIL-1 TaxID=2706126 RepID=UPI0013A738B5|nr:hypothetical protein [Pseudomonas sp. OIL-1]QIB49598.1 hypothetical protein G3M63_00065 [Pseudomonas sp. OIL-1]
MLVIENAMSDRQTGFCANATARLYRAEVLLCLGALPLLAFSLSAVHLWRSGFSWHDQHRVHQLFLLGIAALVISFYSQVRLPRLALFLLAAVLFLGLVSASFAEWPLWALKEWGRYAGLVTLVLLLGLAARKPFVVLAVLGLMAAVGFLHAFQFVVYYSAAFLSGIYMLDADLLFNGFSNPRFFGQFQVLLMPVLAGLALYFIQQKPLVSGVLFGVLSVQWCIALTLGGRGLWLGLAASGVCQRSCRVDHTFMQPVAAVLLAGFAASLD